MCDDDDTKISLQRYDKAIVKEYVAENDEWMMLVIYV